MKLRFLEVKRLKKHFRLIFLLVLVLSTFFIFGCDLKNLGGDDFLESFNGEFRSAIEDRNVVALVSLYHTHLESEDWNQIIVLTEGYKEDAFVILDAYYSEDALKEVIEWSHMMIKWYGEAIREPLQIRMSNYIFEMIKGYQSEDMYALTDKKRDDFFIDLEEKIAILDLNITDSTIFNLDELLRATVIDLKSTFKSAVDFESFSKIAYFIKSNHHEVLKRRLLSYVDIEPYASRYIATNNEGLLTFDKPEDEYLFVLTFDEVHELSNIMNYLVEDNRYNSNTLSLDEDEIYYVIATNENFQPCIDAQVFYGRLDFSRYIRVESESQVDRDYLKAYAIEEMEKYRGIIEPILINGFYGFVEDHKMLVRINDLETIYTYDLMPFNMIIVEGIDDIYGNDVYTLGQARGFTEILLVSHLSKADFIKTFHHEMLHVLEAFYDYIRVSTLYKQHLIDPAREANILKKREVFYLLEDSYLEDQDLSDYELVTNLVEILDTTEPLKYGVLSGYSRFSHYEDSAEIWANMMVNPNVVEAARSEYEIIKKKIEYIHMLIGDIQKLNGVK